MTMRSTQVELLRLLDGSSEHGPHAVVLAPDGKSLYVVAGNATKLPKLIGFACSPGLGRRQLAAPAPRRQRLHEG